MVKIPAQDRVKTVTDRNRGWTYWAKGPSPNGPSRVQTAVRSPQSLTRGPSTRHTSICLLARHQAARLLPPNLEYGRWPTWPVKKVRRRKRRLRPLRRSINRQRRQRRGSLIPTAVQSFTEGCTPRLTPQTWRF